MRRVFALIVTVGVVSLVVSRGSPDLSAARVTGLAVGFTLIAAALAGELFERLRLPRVTGYLLFGMICGPYLANIITRPMARELQLVNGLAVVLIAFIAGLEINVSRLRARVYALLQLSGVMAFIIYAGLFLSFWLAWGWIGIGPDLTGLQRLSVAALLTTIVASFSPTVTIALIAESRASGPLTELTLAIVIIADLALILLFTLVMQFVRFAFGGTHQVGMFISLSWEIFGSFFFGAACGACFAFYLRYVGREVPVALLGLSALIAGFGSTLHLEPLLAALAAGLVVENIAPPRGDILKTAVERGALPVLVVFFAAAGASLQLDALATIGGVAVAVSALRMLLIWIGAAVGARVAGIDQSIAGQLWMGLVSQAGVTLGLTLIVASEFPDWGTPMQTLLVALIAIHQLVGPVLFRAALASTGEIGKMDEGAPFSEQGELDAEPLHAD
jgi:Kef-type K+ transport system membrane component KefB